MSEIALFIAHCAAIGFGCAVIGIVVCVECRWLRRRISVFLGDQDYLPPFE